MAHRTVPFRRFAVVSAATLAALGLGADFGASAWAKSAVRTTVSARVLRLGQSVTVTGTGGDDAARTYRLCVDQRQGGGSWRQLSCSARQFQQARARVRATRRGDLQFRTRLLVGPAGRLDRISPTVTVVVR
ncbi:hypothetical protein [Streptacidiphilus monticola]|uniref:Secreted protein n=1 Tax=Streptacidiphilus monticola TaxID=2161674 RepID=A0ABW1FY76_9ACTN